MHIELMAYAESDELKDDIQMTVHDYELRGETPPPESEIRLSLINQYREQLEQMRACELLGFDF